MVCVGQKTGATADFGVVYAREMKAGFGILIDLKLLIRIQQFQRPGPVQAVRGIVVVRETK